MFTEYFNQWSQAFHGPMGGVEPPGGLGSRGTPIEEALPAHLSPLESTPTDDPYMSELIRFEQIRHATVSDFGSFSPFVANNPPRGFLSNIAGMIIVGLMMTGEYLRAPVNRTSGLWVVSGHPGSGKTTLGMMIISQLALFGCQIVIWDIKGTWQALEMFPPLANRVIRIPVNHFKWSLGQPPPNTSVHEWTNRWVNVLAQAFFTPSAKTVLRAVFDDLIALTPQGQYPTLTMLIEKLKRLKATSWRDRNLVSSMLSVLGELKSQFPGCFEHTFSNFPEQLSNQRGNLVIIEHNGQPVDQWNFIQMLVMEWIYTQRRNNPNARQYNTIQVLEDSTSLLDPGRDRETPGGVSLLAQHLDIGREMGLGVMAICHSLGQISPKILHSLESAFVCSLRGDDLRRAQQIIGLNPVQAQTMRVNPRGTACALVPSVWPYPVMVQFPPFQELL